MLFCGVECWLCGRPTPTWERARRPRVQQAGSGLVQQLPSQFVSMDSERESQQTHAQRSTESVPS